ncbi:MAG: hypothetical protein ACYC2H_00975 [Thermoplasmatota archaeon]
MPRHDGLSPPMKSPLAGFLSLVMLASALVVVPHVEAATVPPVKFGMDAASVGAQTSAGVKPDYATMWIGPWTPKSGWGGPDATLASLKSAGVTPAIHFYYWGDDISPSCVENGCWSKAQNVHKDRAKWRALADELTTHINAKMQGAPVVLFLESEFNKFGIGTYEPFDGYLADMAKRIRERSPGTSVVLGFGSWRPAEWGTFDRAAAASQMVGLQAMRGSTKDSASAYDAVYDSTLSGVRRLAGLFHKPLMVTDLALSSYPEPGYATMQRDNLQEVFNGLPALRDAGVRALIYRSWKDSPTMSTANYYGEGERHFGVAHSDGDWKPAASVWVKGVKAVRAGTATTTAPSSTSTSATATFTATFTPKAVGNDWWIETAVGSSSSISKVEARLDGGVWKPLPKQSWGTYADDLHAPGGTKVQFRATSWSGATALSGVYTWT